MSKEKPALPKGTRDFGPEQMILRNHIMGSIRSVFEKFGFQPLETPAMENLSVLTGKYGDEGDQLIFKVLKSGESLDRPIKSTFDVALKIDKILKEKVDEKALEKIKQKFDFSDSHPLSIKLDSFKGDLTEKGLRYDLTIPFARYVVMNQHNLAFPFKRYQMQPVWRADRPQKGRYREFYQCDADVVGTNSLICEVEIIQMIIEVFAKLNISNYEIKINNRKILEGIAETIGQLERFNEMCVAIDKLDKIGFEKVREELLAKSFDQNSIENLKEILNINGDNNLKLAELLNFSKKYKTRDGVTDIKTILSYLDSIDNSKVNFDIQLARGLSYYTGTIFEVKVNDVSIGSVGGGGRYDDLTGVFGLKDVSGVGFSFGVDRLYDVIMELGLFKGNAQSTTRVLVINFDSDSEKYGLGVLKNLRSAGINSEIYPEAAKLKKQMTYADRKKIPFVILAGENEIRENKVTLKNMTTGEQQQLNADELISILSKH